jgi:hypothetical protein
MKAESQVGLSVHVSHEGGGDERYIVDSERALVGSAAHCEIRLPQEVSAPAQVELVYRDGALHATAVALDPPVFVDRMRLTTTAWQGRGVLRIGGTTIRVEPVALGAKGKNREWVFAVALGVPILAAAASFALTRPASAGNPQYADPPTLFDEPVASCPVKEAEQALAFADEKSRVALAKRERGPFSPRDAVDAVPLVEVARACYAIAGETEAAQQSAELVTQMRRKLEEEYAMRRVRLEHAFETGNAASIRRELDYLLPMTSHRQGLYVDWLVALKRSVDLEVDREEKAKGGFL